MGRHKCTGCRVVALNLHIYLADTMSQGNCMDCGAIKLFTPTHSVNSTAVSKSYTLNMSATQICGYVDDTLQKRGDTYYRS